MDSRTAIGCVPFLSGSSRPVAWHVSRNTDDVRQFQGWQQESQTHHARTLFATFPSNSLSTYDLRCYRFYVIVFASSQLRVTRRKRSDDNTLEKRKVNCAIYRRRECASSWRAMFGSSALRAALLLRFWGLKRSFEETVRLERAPSPDPYPMIDD